ncbi:MAG: protein-L-isoaspartate(D-aspartate) O-methyltransferase [Pseudomonadota bacterium]|nr:protein-L-isoaspartate(D-aspartate) O-methyltransferase [Pseudomonadota bacterium]
MTSQRTRERMVQRLGDQGISNLRVLEAMLSTPRHLFIEEAFAHRAYEDVALPIAFNQTISQPYIVARMTELLMAGMPEKGKVLEIGTGCGYQTAILARLVAHVYSIERISPLLEKTKVRLRELKIANITLKCADGSHGWSQHAPFDGIIVTAAAPVVPEALLKQLADHGTLVVPEGERNQVLRVYRKVDGKVVSEDLEAVRFVPLLGGIER